MGPVTITTASPLQYELISSISRDTFEETFKTSNNPEDMAQYLSEELNEQKMKEELEDMYNLFFIAWVNDTPAGYAKVSTATKADAPHAGAMEIERIYVLQQYQAQKIGAQLMQHCIDAAIEKGCPGIWLGVWEHNQKAISFYERWGFEPYGTHVFRLGTDDQTDILMKKALP